MAPGRKKGFNTPMEERLDILRRIDRGESLKDVAMELGFGVDVVRKWKVDREKIEAFCVKAKRRQLANVTESNEYLDEAVFAWYILRRRQGVAVTGTMIQNKALDFYELMEGSEKFHGFSGWLKTWQQKYGIRLFEPSVEKITDTSAVLAFTRRFLTIIENEGLTRDQIFTCEEAELYYKMLPSKTNFARLEREAPGLETNRDRVTVLACSNASGTLKLPLMVIGKIANPRSLEHLNMENLPVYYAHNKRVRMDHELFKEWFNIEFIPRVTRFLRGMRLPLKALLIIDDSPSHPPEKEITLGAIKTMFFPHNMTCHMQPMNQGVLENLRRRFLYKMLLETQDDNGEIVQRLKSISMKDVIFWAAEAWDGISSYIIEQSWQICSTKGLKKSAPKPVDISNTQFLQVFQRIKDCQHVDEKDVQQWIGKNINAMESLTDQEILSMVMNDLENDKNYEQQNKSFSSHKKATSSAAGYSRQTERSHDMAREDTQQLSPDEEMVSSPAARYSRQIEDSHEMSKGDAQQLPPNDEMALPPAPKYPRHYKGRGRSKQLHSNKEMVASTAASYSKQIEDSHEIDEGEIFQSIMNEDEERDPLSDQAIHSMVTEDGRGNSTTVGDFHKIENRHEMDKGDAQQLPPNNEMATCPAPKHPRQHKGRGRTKQLHSNKEMVASTAIKYSKQIEGSHDIVDEGEIFQSIKNENEERDPLSDQAIHSMATKGGRGKSTAVGDFHKIKNRHEMDKGDPQQLPPNDETATPPAPKYSRQNDGTARIQQLRSNEEMVTSTAPRYFEQIEDNRDKGEGEILQSIKKEDEERDPLSDQAIRSVAPEGDGRKSTAVGNFHRTENRNEMDKGDPLQWIKKEYENLVTDTVSNEEVMDFNRIEGCREVENYEDPFSAQTMIPISTREEEKDTGNSLSDEVMDYHSIESCQDVVKDQNPPPVQTMIPTVMEHKEEEGEIAGHSSDIEMVTSTERMDTHKIGDCQDVDKDQDLLSVETMIPVIMEGKREENTAGHSIAVEMVASPEAMDSWRNKDCQNAGDDANPLSDHTMVPMIMEGRQVEEEGYTHLADSGLIASGEVMGFHKNDDCQDVTGDQDPHTDHTMVPRIIDESEVEGQRNKLILESGMAASTQITDFRRNENSQNLDVDQNPLSEQAMIPMVKESKRDEEIRDVSINTTVTSGEMTNFRRNENRQNVGGDQNPLSGQAMNPIVMESRREEERRDHHSDSGMATSAGVMDFHRNEVSQNVGGNQNLFSGQKIIPLIIRSEGEQQKRDHLYNSGIVTSAGVMDFRRNENCQIVGGNQNPLPNQTYILILHNNRRDENTTDRLLSSSMVTSTRIVDFRRNENCQDMGDAQNPLSSQAVIPTVQESRRDEEQRDRLPDIRVTSAEVMDFYTNKERQDVSGNKNLISDQAMIPEVTESRKEKEDRDRLLGSGMATSAKVMDFRRTEDPQLAHGAKDPLPDHTMIPKVVEILRKGETRDRLLDAGLVRSAEVMASRRNEEAQRMDQPMIPMVMDHNNENEQRNRRLVESEMITFSEEINFHGIECSQHILRERLEQSIKTEYDGTDPIPFEEVKSIDPLDGGEPSSVGIINSNYQAVDDDVQFKGEYEAVDPLLIETQDTQMDESDGDDDGDPSEIKKLTAAEAVDALSYIIKICEDMEDITIEELQLLYKYKDLIMLQNWRKKREVKERRISNESTDTDKQ